MGNRRELQLLDYHIWACDQILDHVKTLPDDLFHREANLGFRSVAEVIGHIAAVDEVWLARMKGEQPPSLAPKRFVDVEEARKGLTAAHDEVFLFLDTITDFEQSVRYTNTKGQLFENTYAEIVTHIVNHGTYHRGNITTMLRNWGYSNVATDYIYYLRE